MIVAALTVPAAAGCSQLDVLTGACGSNDGTSIIIDGTQTTPGSPGTSSPGTSGPDLDQWGDPVQDPFGQPRNDFDQDACMASWEAHIACFLTEEVEDDEKEDDSPAIPAVTIDDLVRFIPAGTALAGEPENVGVAGLPTNFVAAASAHSENGTLFGYPIAVRFTPVGYDFDFGDGSTASSPETGRGWEELGQAQFTPTPTSHTYSERGEYTASVDVRYTAEVDLGIGWFPVSGELTAAGADQQIRIFEARTALVAYTCEQAPASPGC
ncbi:PKD domain-containing protein [Microbacterium tumbae]